MITHTYTQRADGAFDLSIGGVANTPAPIGSPPPLPVPPPPAAPAPSGGSIAVERATQAHIDGEGSKFPIVYRGTLGRGFSRFSSKDMKGAAGQRNKECFSLPFRIEANASSAGVDLGEFDVAPRAFGVWYDVSISRVDGDFSSNAIFVSKGQGPEPSISFSVNEPGRGASCNLSEGDYYFNVGIPENEMAGLLAKPFGWDSNCSVLARGVDVS